ncbi:MAG: rhodanese-like domain-containing protein [Confluentimicrobium sp.]|jgi:rhodanese-related sulfurtransferase|uniref:Rhodanese-related sulfurtransferase n=1 Tax=Actibacterium naphthalenivorans TaxID=1614693 RepID=A0A840C4I8_9RHOB|nr:MULTISPECIES: rhodanese-like domain-containing protein [Actibacterium]ALG89906.1 sulfurtransferase [Actibacterium sp. EMB200-NS6]MBB4020365.1 rhodanese-related sulfurtransferase [Actibacterium naphthalenivorans]MBC55904.1 rhodanese-like domain-containing protein [Actibacterium sp.]MDY6859757.1 rhodanese-like domain-containing protein [Pseudomonadota bacterium]|tara:strand:+ start:929 stop:1309 length:381 start_codon:yes stop_codon:yes gene_type:complete
MHTEDIGGKTLEHWTVDDVEQALRDGKIILIDVRTPQEYMFEYIHGALLAPMAGFDPAFMPPQTDERQIVFHCGSGVRSRKVAEQYLAAGHDRIAHLDGGFAAWKVAAKPYMGTDPATGAPRKVGG